MTSPVITIYRNGDHHFLGKKLVVNRKYYRTFDYFLDRVTQDTQAGYAIRKLHTPQHGTKILNLEHLKNGNIYVAAGPERFKRLAYDKIVGHLNTSKTNPSPLKPVYRNKINVQSRYKKDAMIEPLKNRIIYVYRNGEDKSPPLKLLLDKRTLRDMDVVLQYISNKIQGAVRSLYCLETNQKITNAADINSNMLYVAVGSGKHFIKMKYDLNSSDKLINHNRKKRQSIHTKRQRMKSTNKDASSFQIDDANEKSIDLKEEETLPNDSTIAASPAESINEDELISSQIVQFELKSSPQKDETNEKEEGDDNAVMSTGTSPIPTESKVEEKPVDTGIAQVELKSSSPIMKKEASTSTNEDISKLSSPIDSNHTNDINPEVVTEMISEFSEKAEKTVELHSTDGNKSSDTITLHKDNPPNATIQVTSTKDKTIVLEDSKHFDEGHLSVNLSTILTDEDVKKISATSEKIDTISTNSFILDASQERDDQDDTNIDKELASTSELVRDGMETLNENLGEEKIKSEKVDETSVYKASGKQQESGEVVKDDKNTTVEELIDSVAAEEVEEELDKKEEV